MLVVADTVKPTSAEAVASLKALGLRPVLLTGDNEATARAVAAEVGIDEVIAEVLPADKADVIRRLQADGRVVAMVGDGVNDAPALAQADLGLAIGTGTDVAIEASDLTLVSGDLRAAADAIRLSRATLRTIKQNLVWAFGYNVAALPLAAAGLLNPLLAGLAMAFSSVSVVANALRLRRFRSASVLRAAIRKVGGWTNQRSRRSIARGSRCPADLLGDPAPTRRTSSAYPPPSRRWPSPPRSRARPHPPPLQTVCNEAENSHRGGYTVSGGIVDPNPPAFLRGSQMRVGNGNGDGLLNAAQHSPALRECGPTDDGDGGGDDDGGDERELTLRLGSRLGAVAPAGCRPATSA